MDTDVPVKKKSRSKKIAKLTPEDTVEETPKETPEEKRRRDQDKTLNRLFSYPRVIEDLLTGFVPYSWVKDLDFYDAKKRKCSSYVSQ